MKLTGLNRILLYAVLGQILLLPYMPAFFNKGYEEIKVLGFLYSTLFISAIWLINLSIKKINFFLPPTFVSMTFFIVALAIGAFFGLDPARSFFGASPYFQGLITFFFLYLFWLIISQVLISDRFMAQSLVFSAAGVSVVALIQYMLLQNGNYVPLYAGRVVSTFGQPNFFAGFILLVLPFWLFLWSQKRRKEVIYLTVILGMLLLAIAISFSRTAIILAAILICGWLIKSYIKDRYLKVGIIFLAGVLLIYGLVNARIIEDEIVQPLVTQRVEFSNVQKRIFIWQVAFEQIKKSPLSGYGLENIGRAFPHSFDFNHPKPAFYHSIKDLNIDNTHNIFLNLLMWSGVVGLVSYLIIVGQFFKYNQQPYLKLVMVLFLGWSIFQNLSIIHWLIFFLMIGLASRSGNFKKVST